MWEDIFQWVFSWTGILFLVPICYFALGWGGMSMSPPECLVARIGFVTGTLLLLGKTVIEVIRRKPPTWEWLSIIFISFGILGILLVAVLRRIDYREKLMLQQQMSGVLIPGNKPTPLDVSKAIPDKALTLMFGNSVAYTSKFPHTVIQVGNDKLLVINKKGDQITFSGKFFSKDGKIIAELIDNNFTINPNNYYWKEEPSNNKLIVYDQEGNQSINIEIINPLVIKFLGRFYIPNRPPIIINEDWQDFGMGIRMSNCHLGENYVDIHLK